MKISIITTKTWILNKLANRLSQELKKLGYKNEISDTVNHINIYMDMQNCYLNPTEGYDIGIFTHLHEDNLVNFDKGWGTLNKIVCMNRRYYERLKCICPLEVLSYCVLADPPPWQIKKTKIGIFQRGTYDGKGFNFMLSLPDSNLLLLNLLL
jgi:hypothetical protein